MKLNPHKDRYFIMPVCYFSRISLTRYWKYIVYLDTGLSFSINFCWINVRLRLVTYIYAVLLEEITCSIYYTFFNLVCQSQRECKNTIKVYLYDLDDIIFEWDVDTKEWKDICLWIRLFYLSFWMFLSIVLIEFFLWFEGYIAFFTVVWCHRHILYYTRAWVYRSSHNDLHDLYTV